MILLCTLFPAAVEKNVETNEQITGHALICLQSLANHWQALHSTGLTSWLVCCGWMHSIRSQYENLLLFFIRKIWTSWAFNERLNEHILQMKYTRILHSSIRGCFHKRVAGPYPPNLFDAVFRPVWIRLHLFSMFDCTFLQKFAVSKSISSFLIVIGWSTVTYGYECHKTV